jgi:hypothetical protein
MWPNVIVDSLFVETAAKKNFLECMCDSTIVPNVERGGCDDVDKLLCACRTVCGLRLVSTCQTRVLAGGSLHFV